MADFLRLEKYSIGVGDRFARQAGAQLQACLLAAQAGSCVIPVWNKSNREHVTIGSEPHATRVAADAAVRALGWNHPYYVDADHIRRDTVGRFLPYSDFYTIDVADQIGRPVGEEAVKDFAEHHGELVGRLSIPGIDHPFQISRAEVERVAGKYLAAVKEAGAVYRHIAQEKGEGKFITEISMDETDSPQTPAELLLILVAVADEGIPVQTIAPKFTGRFNKGVDYVGDIIQFGREFQDDLAVVAFAVKHYPLPVSLKLSVHSGSDKFSIYGPICAGLTRFGAGLHLKTAGTTWLEELIGLAEANGEGLRLAKEIYGEALDHRQELCAPYASVIDVDAKKLASAETVNRWSSEEFVSSLRHDQRDKAFNPHLRQLLHVAYKIAAGMRNRYIDALQACASSVSKNVTVNLYERHLKPLFLDGPAKRG